ncbi:MAG: hydrogenase maturation nickel metallochaperone HypA, partial [Pseudomonadales bacterium]|nr:hydrogenase maturation nickel metallochaperone HypA [Pseudomonadales bacterium]
MHEWSLAQQVRELVLEQAREHALSSVRRVTLEVGALSCVEPGNLQFAVKECLQNSIAAPATVRVLTKSGTVRCHHCNKTFEVEDMYQTCAHCDQYGFTIVDGKDMLIT